MASSYYITAEWVEESLGRPTLLKLFDDGNTRTINQAALATTIARASARVNGALPHNYTGTLPLTPPYPENAQELALAYFCAFAYPRNPDVMKALGYTPKSLLDQAEALADLFRSAVVRMIDAPAPVPGNIGGKTGAIGSSCPAPKPKFANMGDY